MKTNESLHVLYEINAPFLRMLMKKFNIEILYKYWKNNKFIFFTVYNDLSLLMRNETLSLENEDKLSLIELIAKSISKATEIEEDQPTKAKISFDKVLKFGIIFFLDTIFKSDIVVEYAYLHSSMLIQSISIKQYNICDNIPYVKKQNL